MNYETKFEVDGMEITVHSDFPLTNGDIKKIQGGKAPENGPINCINIEPKENPFITSKN